MSRVICAPGWSGSRSLGSDYLGTTIGVFKSLIVIIKGAQREYTRSAAHAWIDYYSVNDPVELTGTGMPLPGSK